MFYENLITLIIAIAVSLCSPYLLAFFLDGIVMCRQVITQLKKKEGIEKAVSTWQSLSPEERMGLEIGTPTPVKSNWIPTPTPDEEKRMMNEAVYKKGLVEPKPTTFEDKSES